MEKECRYKAFISYRHHPFDQKVAVVLQKLLETFHPPRQFEKKEKWKIFRDETEFPTSFDLNHKIKEALENSEYLIVICSSELVRSKWCREEISYFKSIHNYSTKNILTVLIEGNPDESFPEELYWSEETRKNSKGEEIQEKIEVEPLAANITAVSEKQSLKKLKNEYLRIAAALLNCRYDDLYQREQKRKIRTGFVILGGVLLIVGGIGIYSSSMALKLTEQKRSLQEENYNRMAVQSNYMWEAGKATEAIESAIDAIPEDTEKMSVFSAEAATAKRLGVFQRENFLPVKKFETTSYITRIAFINNGKNIVAQDMTGIYLWETKSGKLLEKYTKEKLGISKVESPYFAALYFIIKQEKSLKNIELEKIYTDETVLAEANKTNDLMFEGFKIKKQEGKEETENLLFWIGGGDRKIWQVETETAEFKKFEPESEESDFEYDALSDGQIIRYETENEIVVFKENDSNKKENYKLLEPKIEGVYGWERILSISDKICYRTKVKEIENDNYSYENSYEVLAAYPVKNGVVSKDAIFEQGEEMKDEQLEETIKIENYYVEVTCKNPKDGNNIYIYRIYDYDTTKKISETTVYGDLSGRYADKIAGVIKKEDGNNDADIFLCMLDKKIVLVNLESGKIIHEYTFDNKILKIKYAESGVILVVLEDGYEYVVSCQNIGENAKEEFFGYKLHDFGIKLTLCDWNENDYLAVSGNSVYLYQDIQNENCREVEKENRFAYQMKNLELHYPSSIKSKKAQEALQKLEEKSLITEVLWGTELQGKLFVFCRSGNFYRIDITSQEIESYINLRTDKEAQYRESYDEIVVWKTQNPDEFLIQNQQIAWLVNHDKMELRYQIEDFSGYSKIKNEVLMYKEQEEKYWACPLYSAEELKEIGIKWKNIK